MIYLIDDNRHQQQQKYYNVPYLFNHSFANILTRISRKEEILVDQLEQAACILLHASFPNEQDYSDIREVIIEDVAEIIPIPLVLFSRKGKGTIDFNQELSQDLFDRDYYYLQQLDKDIFYAHLHFFLLHYQTTQEIDLRLLAWGKHVTYNKALQIHHQISNLLFTYTSKHQLPNSFFKENRKLIQQLYKLCHPKAKYSFSNSISKEMSVSNLKYLLHMWMKNINPCYPLK